MEVNKRAHEEEDCVCVCVSVHFCIFDKVYLTCQIACMFQIAWTDVHDGIPALGHQTSVCCSLQCPSAHHGALERAQSPRGGG